jgi:tetratricopeptide (TPR) repeat protein
VSRTSVPVCNLSRSEEKALAAGQSPLFMRKVAITILVSGCAIAGCGKKNNTDRVEYTKANGETTSDIHDVNDGKVGYKVLGGATVPAEAQRLHNAARAKGEAGDYESALALLRQAAKVAPDWPYPYYDMAFTYLLQGDQTNAFSFYKETDRREPKGFFTTKTALWTLEREEKGIFPRGTYLAYVSLEWSEPKKRATIIGQMITNLPAFAPAWKEQALLVADKERRSELFDKALSLEPDPETYGICMLNKAAILENEGKTAQARQMVEKLIQDDASTIGTKALAQDVLKKFRK